MDDDDQPSLSADTLALLQEFQLEKDFKAKQFEDLKAKAGEAFDKNNKLSMEFFGEDWNASQFWYTGDTAGILAMQLLDGADSKTHIAIISAPSVFVAARNILSEWPSDARPVVRLLEYDKRFEVLGDDFIPYDLDSPLRIPRSMKHKFDRIICDPPFLSEDCQTKTALTTRYLAKTWEPWNAGTQAGLKLILCTGERMANLIMGKLYGKLGVRTTTFEPEHSKGLSNEFWCYANFQSDVWKWQDS